MNAVRNAESINSFGSGSKVAVAQVRLVALDVEIAGEDQAGVGREALGARG